MRLRALFNRPPAMAALAAAILTTGCEKETEFTITPGLFELCFEDDDDLKPLLSSDSMEIPHRLGRWEYFGFFIKRSTPEPFELFTVHKLPAPPVRLEGQWSKYTPQQATEGMKSDVVMIRGGRLIAQGLHSDDPTGIYLIGVFVDAKEIDTLVFRVIDVERIPYSGQAPRKCKDVSSSQ